MILSEWLKSRHAEVGVGWNRWEEQCGAPRHSFLRASAGLEAFPQPVVLRALAVALGTTPAKVVLACAEELELYDEAADGHLSRTMVPDDVAAAAAELSRVIGAYRP